VGWYRKHFTVEPADAGQRLYLDVDGAMAYAAVWLNGQFVGGWPYGYTSFRLDLTPFVNWGAENVVAIRLDNPPESSRWYPGGGLYRNLWLVKTAAAHVAHWGTVVTTPAVTKDAATVNVDFVIENDSPDKIEASVSTRIYELGADGRGGASPVATSDTLLVDIDPAKARTAARSNLLTIGKPRLWDLQHPNRYVAVTTIDQSGKIVDRYETPFGIRTIRFDPDQGFFLNREHVRINGVCDHHDLGALGAAINSRALERQVQLLQEMGCNAIRTSHNPPAPELLEICDRLGMLVMDEAFDCWRSGKHANDYHLLFDDWAEKDLRALVRRDRNHPSVILWSIGNEIREQGEAEGWRLATHLAESCGKRTGRGPSPRRALPSMPATMDSRRPSTCSATTTSRTNTSRSMPNTRRYPCWAAKPLRASVPGANISFPSATTRPGAARISRSVPTTSTRRGGLGRRTSNSGDWTRRRSRRASSCGPDSITWASLRPTARTQPSS